MARRQFFFSPSYFCDEDCLMCGVPRATRLKADKFDRRHWEEAIDRMGLTKDDVLTLSGGEPLWSRDLVEIVRYASSRYGCAIWILTNGRRFRDASFTESMVGLDISKFIVPVFSHRPAVHNAITQRRNSFADTAKGLENLTRLRLRFQIKFIATKLNHADARATYLWCKQSFPHARFIFSGLTMFGEAVSNADEVAIRFSDAASSLADLLAEADRAGDLVPVFLYPLCLIDPIYWRHYNVGIYDEVVVAPDRRAPAGSGSPGQSPKPERCTACVARRRCVFGWKPAYHARFGDAEFQPILPDRLVHASGH